MGLRSFSGLSVPALCHSDSTEVLPRISMELLLDVPFSAAAHHQEESATTT